MLSSGNDRDNVTPQSPAEWGDQPDRRLPVKLKAMDQTTDRDSAQLDETAPPSDVEPTPSSDVETRPWWQSKLNLGVLALAIALLCGALGWVVGNNRAIPDPNATDIGFL